MAEEIDPITRRIIRRVIHEEFAKFRENGGFEELKKESIKNIYLSRIMEEIRDESLHSYLYEYHNQN